MIKRNCTVFTLAVMLVSSLCSAEVPLGHPDFVPSSDHPVGFRGDGTGCYPGATPPTEWEDKYGQELGKNVLWKTPMPSRTNSSPIVVGKKVFTLADPDLLICADALTGKILWQKQVDHLTLWPADEAKKARAVWNQQLALLYEFWTSYQERQFLIGKSRPGGKYPPVKVPDLDARQARLDALEKEKSFALSEDKGAGYDLIVGMFRQKNGWVSPFGEQQVAIRAELFEKYGFNFEQWRGYITQTFRTPVSDGESIFVALGYGQVASYDLDGKQKWMVWQKPGGPKAMGDTKNAHPGMECGACPSPILQGNRLIVQGAGNNRKNFVTAYDKATGKQLWQTAVGSVKRDVGSPLATRLGTEDVIVLAQGPILRSSDGTIINPDAVPEGKGARTANLAMQGNTAYFNWCTSHDSHQDDSYIEAVSLEAQGTAKTIWRAHVPGAMFVGGTFFDGYIYTGGTKSLGSMFVVQQSDGNVSGVKYPRMNDGFEHFGTTPPCVAGNKVYWSSSGRGKILITSTGPALTEIGQGKLVDEATNDMNGLIEKGKPTLDEYLDRYGRTKDLFPATFFIHGGPFFQGNRMYLRTTEYLYCIGSK